MSRGESPRRSAARGPSRGRIVVRLGAVLAGAIVAGGAVSLNVAAPTVPEAGARDASVPVAGPGRIDVASSHPSGAAERGTLPARTGAGDPGSGRHRQSRRPPATGSGRPFGEVAAAAPRIAIVFDDLGYTMGGIAGELLEIDAPLTFSVLPGLANSVEFAETARRRGHEVLLHLPMEPLDAVRHDPGRNAVRTGLSAAENGRRVAASLASLPDFAGVSNHMGSRATASAELMDLVLDGMKRHGRPLFFLDSRTTPFSVAPERARRAGVPVLRNSLFLDGADEEAVRPGMQTERLEAIARGRGSAIGIGHVRPATVAAVREAVERWRAEGILLVRVSELEGREAVGVDRPFARR